MSGSSNDLPRLPPSGIGEAVRHNLSAWYIKMRFQSTEPVEGRRWKEATSPLSALQSTIGNEFEQRVYDDVRPKASEVVDQWYDWGDGKNTEQMTDALQRAAELDTDSQPILLTQARLKGKIGVFDVSGDSDLILLFPTDRGVHAHVIDIKASWDEKPYQQIQTATYTILLEEIAASVDATVTIGAGIYYRETEIETLSVESVPSFERDAREGDVARILRADGPVTRALETNFEDLPLPSDDKSPYAEVFAVKAVEQSDLSILGLSPGEQEKLQQNGVTSVADAAELYKPVESAKPYDYTDPAVEPSNRQTVTNITEESALAERLPVISQKAQSLLGEIDPDHSHAHDKPWTPWIQSAGPAELPEDNPPYQTDDLPVGRKTMIRVYLNVQQDYVRDKVLSVSGRIDCGRYDGSPLDFGHVVDDIDRDPETWGTYEGQMLDEATSDMFNAIELMSRMTNQAGDAPVHFYVYTDTEKDALYEATRRHESDSQSVCALRELLDQRAGIDQEIISTVLPEVESRMAVKQPDHSIATMIDYLYANDDADSYASVERSDWRIQLDSGEELNLQDAFNNQVFDSRVPLAHKDGSAEVLTRHGVSKDADTFYPIVPRRGAQIPIEYFWAAEDIDVLDTTWTGDSRQASAIERFQWKDKSSKDIRLDTGMFRQLTTKFAHCLHHIERALTYRKSDIPKKSVNTSELSEFTTGDQTLADACREYLDLEAFKQRQEALEVYQVPLERRILDGETVPFRITEVEDEGYFFRAHGELLYDELGFDNPQQIASSSGVKGSDGSGSGDRGVMTEITESDGEYETTDTTPEQIAKSVKASVNKIDPREGTITVQGFRTARSREHIYTESRTGWTVDEENDYQQYIGPGMEFVLDPSPGSRTAEKALRALEHADENPLYQDLQAFKDGTQSIDSSLFDEHELESYLETVGDQLPFKPTPTQQGFIHNTSDYVLLQGPPGTGKTSGALTHSLLSRAFAFGERNEQMTGMVSGLSNKSVDEVLTDVASLVAVLNARLDDSPFENTRLVRLVYDKPPDGGHDEVEYMDYYDETDITKLRQMVMSGPFGTRQQTLPESDDTEAEQHVIVFGTPGRMDGLAGKLIAGSSTDEAYESAYPLFDVLAVDEASMMPIHQILMTSAFLKPSSQVLICGDHRQLPPVQQYEWSDEDRQSIIEHVPYLSVLNYFRYLRGDELSRVPDGTPEPSGVDVPIEQLDETYRCHEVVTEFLRQTIYEQDGISYNSRQTTPMAQPTNGTSGLDTLLDTDAPMSLVIHDDRTSRQVNRAEGTMVNACIKNIQDSESIGVVTPHNAQKGLLKQVCDRGMIDTVERFQGGEKDVMFLSTTVSDPAHLADEEEFLLSPNRLNVALSRMRKKLVVIVPATVFELVPQETDVYDDARVWKRLYAAAARDDPEWNGTLGNLVGAHGLPSSSVDVSVYNIESL